MHLSDNPDTRQKLLHSLDMVFFRRQFILCGVFALIAILVPFLSGTPDMGILPICMVLPLLAFYLYRIWQIFREQERYIFRKVKLEEPHHNFWTKTMYFTVTFEDPRGQRISRDTRAIFYVQSITEPLMEDYVNQTVTIAYNPLTDTLVVIG